MKINVVPIIVTDVEQLLQLAVVNKNLYNEQNYFCLEIRINKYG